MVFIYALISLSVIHSMITDILYRRIFNFNSAIVVVLSILLHFYNIQLSLSMPFIVLVIGFVLFAFNVWGAGDAKLCFALTLSLPLDLFFFFFLVMSISGGIIATMMLIFPSLKGRYVSVPYGLPIGIGYLLSLCIGILNGSISFI